MSYNILWKGNIFNATGIATAGREWVKALVKLGHKVQVSDIWNSYYSFNDGLEFLNYPIDAKSVDATIFWDYPMHWRDGYGILIGGFVHEGTRLWDGWAEKTYILDGVFAPSNATKNLMKWNGVRKTIIKVIPHGVDTEIYKLPEEPYNKLKNESFTFLSVNSWGGYEGDRKGTDLLIKAFDEEFKDEKNVKLLLKISTFWMPKFDVEKAIEKILGHKNENILFNDKLLDEKELVTFYQNADVFVAPTRGEGFGLTILNSLACGLPVIVTKDYNSGHMDFCKNNPAVLFVEAPNVKQGDPAFFCPGNMLAEPDIESLKKQMRYAYENRKELIKMGLEGSKLAREWTWEKSAKMFIDLIKEIKEGAKNEDINNRR